VALTKAREPGLEIAAMPKVTVAKDDYSLARENNVWLTGQGPRI
jgi:hypothetical protein